MAFRLAGLGRRLVHRVGGGGGGVGGAVARSLNALFLGRRFLGRQRGIGVGVGHGKIVDSVERLVGGNLDGVGLGLGRGIVRTAATGQRKRERGGEEDGGADSHDDLLKGSSWGQ